MELILAAQEIRQQQRQVKETMVVHRRVQGLVMVPGVAVVLVQ